MSGENVGKGGAVDPRMLPFFGLLQFNVIKRCLEVSRNQIQITNAKRGLREEQPFAAVVC